MRSAEEGGGCGTGSSPDNPCIIRTGDLWREDALGDMLGSREDCLDADGEEGGGREGVLLLSRVGCRGCAACDSRLAPSTGVMPL